MGCHTSLMGCHTSLMLVIHLLWLASKAFSDILTSPAIDHVTMTSSSSSPLELTSLTYYNEDIVVEFSEEPQDLSVVKDQPITMGCYLTSRPSSSPPPSSSSLNNTVTWLIDGLPFIYDDKRKLLSNGSLYLSNSGEDVLTKSEEGSYQCRVGVPGVGVAVSRVGRLKIAYMDRSWTKEQQPSPILLYPGDSIILGCHVTSLPPAKVKWFKEDREIETWKFRDSLLVHSDGVLEIPEVTKSHFGRYKCRVTNESERKGKTSRSISIDEEIELGPNIDSPPIFFYKPKDTTSLEGSELLLHCGANGRHRNGARAAVKWLKDGETMDLSSGEMRRRMIGRGSLSIARVTRDDRGYYTCRVSNSEDVVEATAHVEILSLPSFVIPLKQNHDPPIQITTDFELICSTTGNPPPVVTWFKDGRRIVDDIGRIQLIDENMGGAYKLRVLGSTSDDSGIYQCMASNNVGSSQTSTVVTVAKETEDSQQWSTTNMTNISTIDNSRSEVGIIETDSSSIRLSWKRCGGVNGCLVRWRENSSERIRSLKTNQTLAHLRHLLPSRNYSLSLLALDGERHTSYLEVRTMDAASTGPIVNDLRAMPISSRSILLTWHQSIDLQSIGLQSMSLIYQLQNLNSSEVRIDLPVEVTSFQVDHLLPHSSYHFVLGVDDVDGAKRVESVEVIGRTYSGNPTSPPEDVKMEINDHNNIIMTWERPKEANGPITGYKVKYKIRSTRNSLVTVATDAKQQYLELSGFNTVQEMVFRVQALNVNGSGPFSSWVSTRSPNRNHDESKVPGQPNLLTVRSYGIMVFITWLPPSNNDRITVRGYILSYGVGVPEVFRQTFDARHRQYTIKNLKPSSEYVISLRAFNGAGEGEPVYNSVITGDLIDHVTQLPLIPPVGLKATVLGSSSILLSWSDVITESGSFADFATFGSSDRSNVGQNKERLHTVRYNMKASKKYKLLNTTQLSMIINDLRPDTEYEFSVKVRLKNNKVSTWSLSVFNRTKEIAPTTPPRDLTPLVMEGRSTSVILNWQPPKVSNGQVTGYLVHYTTNVSHDERNWVTEAVMGEKLTATIRGLSPETTYYFRVQARNSAGDGPLSSIVLLKTHKQHRIGIPNIMEAAEEDGHFQYRKYLKIPQGMVTTSPLLDIPSSHEIPQWLFWVVVIGLVLFVLFSVLTLVAVVRCRRMAKQRQRRSQKMKASSETQSIANSLLLSPTALNRSLSSSHHHHHHHSMPPDVCQNPSEMEITNQIDKNVSVATLRRSEGKDLVEDRMGICGSFYYFPSKASGSFKRGSNSYNPGWAYPSRAFKKHQEHPCFFLEGVDGLHPQNRASENLYFIPLEHNNINHSESLHKKLEISEEEKIKRLSDIPALCSAPRVDAGDMNDAKKTKRISTESTSPSNDSNLKVNSNPSSC